MFNNVLYRIADMDERYPGIDAGLDRVEQKMATLTTLAEALQGRQDLPGVLISQLVEIADDAEALAINCAVAGVQGGRMTRRNAADRLRIHSHTLQRIIDERAEHDGQETV